MRRGWCCIGVALGMLAQPATAGPWVLWEGESYTSVTASVTKYDELVFFDGRRASANGLRFVGASLSHEWGLTDEVTLSLSIPYESARGDNRVMAPRRASWGDIWLGARKQLPLESDDGLALGYAVAVKIPGSDYRTDILSAPGDGQVDLELRALAGRVFGSDERPAYWDVEAAYRFRRESPGNEFVLYLECGRQLADRWHGRVFLDHVDQLSGYGLLQPGWTPGDFPAVEEDTDLLGMGATYSLRDDLQLDLSYGRHVHVENSAKGWYLSVSVVSHRMPF